jgi:membrane protein implicated in regulation of membrane protease activity
MTVLRYLFAWANAPFTTAAGIAIIFAILSASGLLGLLAGGGEGEGDHEVDHDVDAGGDADHEVDHDVDHDADHDADGDDEASSGGRGFGAIAFGPLGVGKVPFSIIWQTYALVFAVVGLAVNQRFAAEDGSVSLRALLFSGPIALVTGYAAVALLARVLGPVLSSRKEDATSRKELIGQMGVVISSRVSDDFGEVRVKDKSGHDLRVICKLARGMRSPHEKESVVIVELSAEGVLFVAPVERPDEPDEPGDVREVGSQAAAEEDTTLGQSEEVDEKRDEKRS